MSELSDRLIRAAEAAIDGHHRAHLGEAQSAVVAVLRELFTEIDRLARESEGNPNPYGQGVADTSGRIATWADEIEADR